MNLDILGKVELNNLKDKLDKEIIYTGQESIPFSKRHPIFKSLMRLEFEEAIIDYIKSKK
ncbi:MAG: hypothetical protein ACFE9I_18625 [Candidatus Hermodarchaeota archaeon]